MAAKRIPHVVVGIDGANGANVDALRVAAVGVNRGEQDAGRIGHGHGFRAGGISTAAACF